VLSGAVDDYAHLLAQMFLGDRDDVIATLERLAADHGYGRS
jgi:hypothetical protein